MKVNLTLTAQLANCSKPVNRRFNEHIQESVKRAAISMARDSWEIYFSRLFPAMVGLPEDPFLPAQSSQG